MEVNQLMKQVFLELFPTVRAYMNFFMIWVFVMVMLSTTPNKPSIVLISSIGTLYCFNEWTRRHDKNGS